MANEPDDNPPFLREKTITDNAMPSTRMQEALMCQMLTILQKMEENQQKAEKDRAKMEENHQKAEKDRGERESKIWDQLLSNQKTMIEMMKASHKTEKTGERWGEGSSETVTEEDIEETTFIPPVVQDSTVSTTGHTISGKTVMVGRHNKKIVNKNIRYNIVCVLKNSDQSSSVDLSNSVERDLRKAICDPNNEVVPQLEQMLNAKLAEVHSGSIILVFLTASRNHFRKLFFRHEQQIKHLIENCVVELLRETKDSEASYTIEVKLEDDSGKDKSGTGISSKKKDNPQNDEKHSGDEDDDDDDADDDDDNHGAISANTYISGSLDENRHESGIHPDVLGENKFSSSKCNRAVDGVLRRNNPDKIDEASSSSNNYTSNDNGVNFKKKGVLKNKNRLPLKMHRWQSHGKMSTRQENFRDAVDDNSDDDKEDNLHGEQRSMVSTFPDVSQEDRIGTLIHSSKDDLQNYDNNLDDKDSKDDEDSREKSTKRQFGPVDTRLDIIYRRDQGMSEEDFLHSDRNHRRRKVSKGGRSDDNTRNPGFRVKCKDGRGVQRGECKGCNECFEFTRDVRCDYCNCAATQHISLIHRSSNLDTTASTSKLGNLPESKGKDGRGVQRGECSGCTECSQFRGDVRCDYCNCTATQHVKVTHLPTDKTGPSTFSREASENAKGKDGRGVQRGKCAGCTECSEFRGDVRCDYCNCAATQHLNLTHLPSDIVVSTSSSGSLQPAKSKDRQGIRRGHCKACIECLEFRGSVRCDYCNCAATQHVNLKRLPSDPSTFSRGGSQNAKGKDSQGIWRGHCKGCTECLGFTGDARCDYCNCAATQHVNLMHPSSEKTDPSTFSRGASENGKGKDGRGVKRGKCSGCTECSEFRGDVRCDYCNCTATQHVSLTHPSSAIDISLYLPGTSQRGIDSRGVRRGHCTHCNECDYFTGADRCDYCSCTATEHIIFTDPSSNTGYKNNWSDFELINKDIDISIQKYIQLSEQLVDVSAKRVLPSWTQSHTLRIGVRSHFEQPDGVSQTELQQRFNDSIQNKLTQIRKDVHDVFGAEFKDIRFENGSIIMKMLTHQLERDAEMMLMGRRVKIENYVKSLVKDILPLQFMNLNWAQRQTLYLEIDMGGIFTSSIQFQL